MNPIAASSVMAAVGSENSASRFGWTGLVRPSRVSRKPTGYRPSWSEISDSCCSRRSSEGCVEKTVDRLTVSLLSAGAK